MWRSRFQPGFLSWVLALLVSCAEAPLPEPPSLSPPRLVVVYSTCSLNRNYIAPYNPEIETTPNLAKFAGEALVFERHHTEAGSSGVAFASILTGGQSPHHKVFHHPSRIDSNVETLSELFANAGYQTYYWWGHPMTKPELNYGQGVPPEHTFHGFLQRTDQRFKGILESLREDPEARAFILHTNAAPHAPYSPPREMIRYVNTEPEVFGKFDPDEVKRLMGLFRENHIGLAYNYEATVRDLGLSDDEMRLMSRMVEAAYAIRVRGLDSLFGEIWDRIVDAGLADESLVVFTSDHGEVLDRENALFRWAHGQILANEVMQVPLIVRGTRGRVPAGRYPAVTRSIDLLPTLAGLAGLEPVDPSAIEGVDLSPAIRGFTDPPDLTAHFRTEFNPTDTDETLGGDYAVVAELFPDSAPESIWVGASRGDLLFKLRQMDGKSWKIEAFDVVADPTESRDLFDPTDRGHAEVAEQLRAYKSRMVDAFRDYERDLADELGVEERERLEALRGLGYVQ